MKIEDIVLLVVAGAATFWALRAFGRPAPAQKSTGYAYTNPAIRIDNNADPGEPGWGWNYFTDGVSIGPDGSYYLNGRKVWTPA